MIEFINLSFSHKGTDKGALRKLHLKIPESQCVLLCGVSGCGKTTLTRLVNGLIPHFFEGKLSGKVIVEEMNVAETEISTLSDSVGTVFQNPRTQFFNTDTDSEIVFGLENRMLEPIILKRQLGKVVKENAIAKAIIKIYTVVSVVHIAELTHHVEVAFEHAAYILFELNELMTHRTDRC